MYDLQFLGMLPISYTATHAPQLNPAKPKTIHATPALRPKKNTPNNFPLTYTHNIPSSTSHAHQRFRTRYFPRPMFRQCGDVRCRGCICECHVCCTEFCCGGHGEGGRRFCDGYGGGAGGCCGGYF